MQFSMTLQKTFRRKPESYSTGVRKRFLQMKIYPEKSSKSFPEKLNAVSTSLPETSSPEVEKIFRSDSKSEGIYFFQNKIPSK